MPRAVNSTALCFSYTFAIGASLLLLIIRDARNSLCWSGACLRGQRINVPARLWQLANIPMGKGKLPCEHSAYSTLLYVSFLLIPLFSM